MVTYLRHLPSAYDCISAKVSKGNLEPVGWPGAREWEDPARDATSSWSIPSRFFFGIQRQFRSKRRGVPVSKDAAYVCAAFLALCPRHVSCLLNISLTLHVYSLHRLEWIVRGSGEAKLTVDFQRAGTLEVAVEVDGDATLAAAM